MAKKKDISVGGIIDVMNLNRENRESTAHEARTPSEGRAVVSDPFNQPKARKKVSVKNTRPVRVQLWLDEELKEQMDMVKFRDKLENQDLMYAALKMFASEYVTPDGLTDEGRRKVRELLG